MWILWKVEEDKLHLWEGDKGPREEREKCCFEEVELRDQETAGGRVDGHVVRRDTVLRKMTWLVSLPCFQVSTPPINKPDKHPVH